VGAGRWARGTIGEDFEIVMTSQFFNTALRQNANKEENNSRNTRIPLVGKPEGSRNTRPSLGGQIPHSKPDRSSNARPIGKGCDAAYIRARLKRDGKEEQNNSCNTGISQGGI
jgi:hypothetical protein